MSWGGLGDEVQLWLLLLVERVDSGRGLSWRLWLRPRGRGGCGGGGGGRVGRVGRGGRGGVGRMLRRMRRLLRAMRRGGGCCRGRGLGLGKGTRGRSRGGGGEGGGGRAVARIGRGRGRGGGGGTRDALDEATAECSRTIHTSPSSSSSTGSDLLGCCRLWRGGGRGGGRGRGPPSGGRDMRSRRGHRVQGGYASHLDRARTESG